MYKEFGWGNTRVNYGSVEQDMHYFMNQGSTRSRDGLYEANQCFGEVNLEGKVPLVPFIACRHCHDQQISLICLLLSAAIGSAWRLGRVIHTKPHPEHPQDP